MARKGAGTSATLNVCAAHCINTALYRRMEAGCLLFSRRGDGFRASGNGASALTGSANPSTVKECQ
jgi:hypothetical protein